MSRREYDLDGRLAAEVLPLEHARRGAFAQGYRYTYDRAGRRLQATAPGGILYERNTYDAAGNVIRDIDGAVYGFDLSGRRTSVTTPEGSSQTFAYDASGNLTCTTDSMGYTTRFQTDAWGRVTLVTRADGSHERYTYDHAGNILTATDGEGHTASYAYNCRGLLSTRTDAMGASEHFRYDREGNMVESTDRNGVRLTLTYNMYQSLTGRRSMDGGINGEGVLYTEYSYDRAENLLIREEECYMSKYTELDKDLKKIRNNSNYDLYKINLESQRRIDKFYNEEIPGNDMMSRKYKLDSYIKRRNILYFPIIITIIFGLLVNLVFAKFDGFTDFYKIYKQLQTIPTGAEGVNVLDLAGLYIMLYILLIVVTDVLVCIFFIPFPPLYFLFDIDRHKQQQMEYELTILNDKIDEKIKKDKVKDDYVCCVKKYSTRQMLCIIGPLIVMFIFGYTYGLTWDKIAVLTLIGGVTGYNVLKVNKDNENNMY